MWILVHYMLSLDFRPVGSSVISDGAWILYVTAKGKKTNTYYLPSLSK